jgi:5'-nucleotidase/UDP-sugar diphosphatase
MKRPKWLVVASLLVAALILAGCTLSPTGTPTAMPIAGTTPGPQPTSGSAPGAAETITILYTNDLHGAVEPDAKGHGGLVNLVSLVDQLRAEDPGHTLLLDAGDSFQGTYVSNSTQGEVVMAAMNIAGYDAWTLGNHEFDWGQEVLRARIDQAAFPALAANVIDTSTAKVWDAVQPYTILHAGQVRVGVLGLAYPDTPGITKPQDVAGLEFRGAVETVRHYLPELQEQADLIVVLSHLGLDGDQALARAVDGIDVIVGGHSHVFLDRPSVVNGTIIVQAGAKGQDLGRLDLELNPSMGQVTDVTAGKALLPVTGDVAAVNQEAKALVDAALAQAAETMNQPIGESEVALEPQRSGEFALGNLITDALLAAEAELRPVDGRPVDVALYNNGGIRDGLPKGPITFGQLYAVLPFDDQLMAMDLTGAQILKILEHSVASRPGALQVAGLSFRFRMSSPVGQRVREVTVGGQPLDPARVYRVVTVDYLAAGGDGYDTFLEGANLAYGDVDVWTVADYIRAHSPVHPKSEGRIVQQ